MLSPSASRDSNGSISLSGRSLWRLSGQTLCPPWARDLAAALLRQACEAARAVTWPFSAWPLMLLSVLAKRTPGKINRVASLG